MRGSFYKDVFFFVIVSFYKA